MIFSHLRDRLAGVIGNLLEHYDNALFGVLAPFIAPLFFENHDPITALILTYGIMPLGLIMRPLGSICFGWIGDCFGRRIALFFSLFGMAIVTMSIGFLPVYKDIGAWAPILLTLARMLQSFFSSGESAGGAVYVLEHTHKAERGLISSVYDASSIAGILIASGFVTLLSSLGIIEVHWRYLFWAGGATAFFGVYLRWMTKDGAEYNVMPNDSSIRYFQAIKKELFPLLFIILAAAFSYTTYSLAFTLMNGFIPLITSHTKAEVMQINTALLVVDMCLLPCFGYLATKIGKEKVMLAGALCSAITAIPLFSLLDHASLTVVFMVRFFIVMFGVAFAAPFHAWAIERVQPHHRYLILSLGYALGSQLGTPTSAVCLWLYKILGWSFAPGIYLMAIALIACWVVSRTRMQERIGLSEING